MKDKVDHTPLHFCLRVTALITLLFFLPSSAISKENIKLRLGGRMHIDGVWFKNSPPEFKNDIDIRRARMSLRADLFEHWRFFTELDLADEDKPFESLWLSYRRFDSSIRFGQFVEPFGLENSTSSNSITFLERALPTALTPGTNVGLALSSPYTKGSSAIGIFWETYVEDSQPFDHKEGTGLSGRFTYAPLHRSQSTLHLGISASMRKPNETNRVRFRSRPETRLTSERLINTKRIKNVKRFTTIGFESGFTHKAFSMQGEYIQNQVDLNNHNKNEAFHGAYVNLSWIMTGEQRPYTVKRGKFGKIKPKRSIGAWEIAIRKSYLDLNGNNVNGGREDNITLGVNWFSSSSMRWMWNIIQARTDQTAEKLTIFLMRFQWST